MSLIKKSDVKNHLFTGASVYPFGLTRPDPKANSGSTTTDTKVDVADISISPSHPIAPEATPNAQVGGSVGVPAGAETLRKSGL
jgi:hypothetical protein